MLRITFEKQVLTRSLHESPSIDNKVDFMNLASSQSPSGCPPFFEVSSIVVARNSLLPFRKIRRGNRANGFARDNGSEKRNEDL